MRFSFFLLVGILLAVSSSVTGQNWNRDNTPPALLFSVGYGPELPVGDLSARFGLSWSPEVNLDFITRSNWMVGVQTQLYFGSTVEEDVLANLRTSAGTIIGNDRSPADIQLSQRGFYVGGQVGKLISLSEKNTRAGLRVNVGMGLLQHRINIQEDPLTVVPQLTGDYEAGYDRLTNGLAIHQFVGYQVIGIDNGINIIAGFEFTQAFTRSRRDYDFLTQMADTADRFDGLVGFRFSFTLPLWLDNADEIFY